MIDPVWKATHEAVSPLLNDSDVVLAPPGGWAAFPCKSRFYKDLISTEDASVLIFHKGWFSAIRKLELEEIARTWQCVYANEVFVVFTRTPRIKRDYRRDGKAIHYRSVDRFLNSRKLRKRKSRIYFIHVGKAGGTALWTELQRAFPAHLYFPGNEIFLSNPPDTEDYDVIGGHLSWSAIAPYLDENDWVVGMVRDPIERVLSGILHCRRATVDPEAISPGMRAMREMPIADFLATEYGHFESRLHLIMFGTDHRKSFLDYADEDMLRTALDLAGRRNVILGPSNESQAFAEHLGKTLSFKVRALQRMNVNPRAALVGTLDEFQKVGSPTVSTNCHEREFYDEVCKIFRQRRAEGVSRSSSWMRRAKLTVASQHAKPVKIAEQQ